MFDLGNGCFNLFKDSINVGSGILVDGLYKFTLSPSLSETHLTLHHDRGTVHHVMKKNSSFLWHQKLGHISRDRLRRLVKDSVLPDLDFTDYESCVDCIKGKETKPHKRKEPLEVLSFLR